jgi:hypothetical protein
MAKFEQLPKDAQKMVAGAGEAPPGYDRQGNPVVTEAVVPEVPAGPQHLPAGRGGAAVGRGGAGLKREAALPQRKGTVTASKVTIRR